MIFSNFRRLFVHQNKFKNREHCIVSNEIISKSDEMNKLVNKQVKQK